MRAVERTLRVLEILAEAEQAIRLADVCRESGLDGSTALRYLHTFIATGYAVHDPGDRTRYRAGPRLLKLGGSSEFATLRRVARPLMASLRDTCGEDVNLGTMDDGAALCLETQKSSHILGASFASGLRVPAYASSLGKAILAYLAEDSRRAMIGSLEFERFTEKTITLPERLETELAAIRRQGYSVDREEFTPGVVCIAAPVFNAQGRVVAAVSITAPAQRLPLSQLEGRYSEPLRYTCAAISAGLGHTPADPAPTGTACPLTFSGSPT